MLKGREKVELKKGMFALLNRGIDLFFGLAIFVFLVRVLDKSSFGAWVLYFSYLSLVDLIRFNALKLSCARFFHLSNSKGERTEVTHAVSSLNVIITAIVFSVVLFVSPVLSIDIWKSPELLPCFYLSLVTITIQIPFTHNMVMLYTLRRLQAMFWVNMTVKALFFIVILCLYSFEALNLINMALSLTGCYSVGALVGYFLIPRYYLFHPKKSKSFAAIASYGKYTLGTSLSSVGLKNIDSWMLASFLGPSAVAIYGTAIKVSNQIETPSIAIGFWAFPKIVQKLKEEGVESLKHYYITITARLLAISLPFVVVVFFFAEPLVELVAGHEYLVSARVLQTLVFIGLMLPFNRFLGLFLDALGKANLNMLFVFRDMILNVGLNLFFITNYGIVGAAYATLLSQIIALILNQYYLMREFGVRLTFNVKPIMQAYRYWWGLSKRVVASVILS